MQLKRNTDKGKRLKRIRVEAIEIKGGKRNPISV